MVIPLPRTLLFLHETDDVTRHRNGDVERFPGGKPRIDVKLQLALGIAKFPGGGVSSSIDARHHAPPAALCENCGRWRA